MSDTSDSVSRAMLKRKYSDTAFVAPATKRFRTFSEPRHVSSPEPKAPPHMAELNPLLFGIYQTWHGSKDDIKGYMPDFNPLRIAQDGMGQSGLAHGLSLHHNEGSITDPHYPLETSPSSSGPEQTDGSSDILISVETPMSSQVSLEECHHVYDRSRGPTFSPITNRSSPVPATSHAEDTDIELHDVEENDNSAETIARDVESLDQPAESLEATSKSNTTIELNSLAHDHVQVPDERLSSTIEQAIGSPEAPTTEPNTVLQQEHPPPTQTSEPSIEAAAQAVSNSSQPRTSLVKLRFADRTAFASFVEGLSTSRELSTPSAGTIDDMGRYELRSEQNHPAVSDQFEPSHDSRDDQHFVEQVKTVLKAQGRWKTMNVARRSARRICQLLEVAEPPNTSEGK